MKTFFACNQWKLFNYFTIIGRHTWFDVSLLHSMLPLLMVLCAAISLHVQLNATAFRIMRQCNALPYKNSSFFVNKGGKVL
jgi:hypothetical protein